MFITPPRSYRFTAWGNIIENSGYFFSRSAMRFFESRISWASLTPVSGDYFFITSEQAPNGSRRYTLRLWQDGNIITHSDFQAFATLGEAKTALKHEASK